MFKICSKNARTIALEDLISRDLGSLHMYFHVNYAKFLRTSFSIELPWWLLLECAKSLINPLF